VPIFEIALFLTIAGIATFPCWRYSRKLGYGPSASAGILLVVIALMTIGHKSDAPTNRGPTAAPPSTFAASNAVPQKSSD
jgi:hypothetical protein